MNLHYASGYEEEGQPMTSPPRSTNRILGAVKRMHGCDLDTLVQSLPDLSWSQVFLEVDRLSRKGEVLVTFGTGGRYLIRLSNQKVESAPHQLAGTDQRGNRREASANSV